MLNFAVILLVFFIIFLLIKITILKPSPSDTPAGAVVMACGIFINGAMKNIDFLENNFSKEFTILLFLLWLFIWASFANSFINKTFINIHMKNPIKSFAIGTWVAGTSVCGIALHQRLGEFYILSYILFFISIGIWLFYLCVILRGYSIIFSEKLFNKVNGILLISTVSTQSLVILANTIFDNKYLAAVSRSLILLGVIFYIAAFILIINRYFFTDSLNIEDDWQNTNCILHGAMSITGLASTVSEAVDSNLILLIWLWVLLWFVIVETIEIIRAWKRVKKYGLIKGIAVYDVTQWSRIFTIGMLYTYTMRFDPGYSGFSNSLVLNLRNIILQQGTWVMVCILIIEGLLYFKYQTKSEVIK